MLTVLLIHNQSSPLIFFPKLGILEKQKFGSKFKCSYIASENSCTIFTREYNIIANDLITCFDVYMVPIMYILTKIIKS